MEGIYTTLSMFFLLLLFSAFFSASESAYYTERKKLFHTPLNENIKELVRKPEKFLAAILIMNNIVNISITALITYEVMKWIGEWAVPISTVLVVGTIIVAGEILPKVWGVRNSQEIVKIVLGIISLLAKFMKPIITPIEAIFRKMGEEQLKTYIPIEDMDWEQIKMVEGVANLKELELKDIMIPASRVSKLDINMDIEQTIREIEMTKHTRYPVISDGKVVGILLSKNLLFVIHEILCDWHISKLKLKEIIEKRPEILKPAKFAPPNKSVVEQLRDFRKWKTHMVCVINDFGEFEGIVTLEDIIEEIIGNVEDEHSIHTEYFWKDNQYIYARGETPIRDINREFGLNIDDRFMTVSSTIVSISGGIPEKGEKIKYKNWEFEILDTQKTKINLVRIRNISDEIGEKVEPKNV